MRKSPTNEIVKDELTQLADALYAKRHSYWEILLAVEEWVKETEEAGKPLFGTRARYLELCDMSSPFSNVTEM